MILALCERIAVLERERDELRAANVRFDTNYQEAMTGMYNAEAALRALQQQIRPLLDLIKRCGLYGPADATREAAGKVAALLPSLAEKEKS